MPETDVNSNDTLDAIRRMKLHNALFGSESPYAGIKSTADSPTPVPNIPNAADQYKSVLSEGGPKFEDYHPGIGRRIGAALTGILLKQPGMAQEIEYGPYEKKQARKVKGCRIGREV